MNYVWVSLSHKKHIPPLLYLCTKNGSEYKLHKRNNRGKYSKISKFTAFKTELCICTPSHVNKHRLIFHIYTFNYPVMHNLNKTEFAIFMPQTSKKLREHIGLILSVCPLRFLADTISEEPFKI